MSEEIRKSFSGGPIKADAAADIDLINRHAIRTLSPDEVRCFSVVMCDNDIDRETERFTDKTLESLASLFVGKTVISDHSWKSGNQIGRIYSCKVRTTQKRNKAGGVLKQLVGKFYVLNNESNKAMIDAIEGGILKEVSVGVSIKSRTCSLCGEKMHINWSSCQMECGNHHVLGETYPGEGYCFLNLDDPGDAYELSFVAVPAQPGAGVTKGRKAGQQISPEELQRRKEILLENERFLSKFQASENKPERKDYEDFVPYDDCSPGNILFAMIPVDAIPENVKHAAYEALGFCRKELAMQRIDTKWFATIEYAERLGFKWDELKKFHYMPNICGMASRKNPNQILVRYPRSIPDIQKTIFHEVWHTFQMKDANNQCMEENAYWYMDDAYKRFMALSAEEKRSLYWYSHT